MFFNKYYSLILTITIPAILFGQNPNLNYNKFKQLKQTLIPQLIFNISSTFQFYSNFFEISMNLRSEILKIQRNSEN